VSQPAFAIDPTVFGLPSRAQWQAYRIWDSYYFPRGGAKPGTMLENTESDLRELEPFCVERFCAYLHVGLGTLTTQRGSPAEDPGQNHAVLQRWGDRVLGVIHLNANDVQASLAALDTWGKEPRVVGVCFKSSQPGCLVCTHPNFDPLVERCSELGLMIMQHTWFKAGGKDDPGDSRAPAPAHHVHFRARRRGLGAGNSRRARLCERLG
jgi:hypothetical protein